MEAFPWSSEGDPRTLVVTNGKFAHVLVYAARVTVPPGKFDIPINEINDMYVNAIDRALARVSNQLVFGKAFNGR